jgi:hypothetical protein
VLQMQQLPALLSQGYHTSLKAPQGPVGLQPVMLLLLLHSPEVQEQAALAAMGSSSSTPADMRAVVQQLTAMHRRRSRSISHGGSCSRSVQRALPQVLLCLLMPACSRRCRLPAEALAAAAGAG